VEPKISLGPFSPSANSEWEGGGDLFERVVFESSCKTRRKRKNVPSSKEGGWGGDLIMRRITQVFFSFSLFFIRFISLSVPPSSLRFIVVRREREKREREEKERRERNSFFFFLQRFLVDHQLSTL
jgi:hypothetical protein